MRSVRCSTGLLILAELATAAYPSARADDRQDPPPGVMFLDVPDSGIQPQAVDR